MSENQNRLLPTYLVILIAWLVSISLGIIAHGSFKAGFPKTYFELGIHACIFMFIFSYRGIRDYFLSWPLLHRFTFIAFFVLLFAGQFVNNLWFTYPFTTFGMYSKPEHRTSIEYVRLKAADDTGREFFISPEKTVPSNDKATVITRIKRFAVEAFDPKKSEKARATQLEALRTYLSGVGKIYNATHGDSRIVSLKLLQYQWDYRKQKRDEVVPETLLVLPIIDRGESQ